MPTPAAPPTPGPPPAPGQAPIIIGFDSSYTAAGPASNNLTISGLGADSITGGDTNTVILNGGFNTVSLHDHANLTMSGGTNSAMIHDNGSMVVYGGGNTITMHDSDVLTINDTRTEGDGFSGNVVFGDNITGHNGDSITLNYGLTLGNSDTVTVGWNGTFSGLAGNTSLTNVNVVNAGKGDSINFATASINVTLNAGSGDTISTTAAGDTITLGGTAATKSSLMVGATAAGTTINGGLGTDTFTGGAGYDGGNHYVGSAQSNADGFNAIGSCANYANLACRVTVNYNTNVGQGFDANGNLLWTDTYANMQQVKAAELNGNILTGSNSYFCELKGGNGSTSFYGGAAGDRIIWSSAGATGLLDGQGTDVAYGGTGADEYYWRNSPGGKGVSNFGETINGFSEAKGDDLNLSEFADAGFAGVSNAFTFNDLSNWVSIGLNGNDTDVYFDKTGSSNFSTLAVVLKNDNLFADFGVTDHSSVGAQQVAQDMYNTGHLVLTLPH
ncbi:MAG: hypothetical protein JO001_01800 [Alphaproteobacteria bacterium]|nr:hypothetical protein [Alphaproteobacteria bacterium]